MQNKGVFLSRSGIACFKEHYFIQNTISHHGRLRAVDLVMYTCMDEIQINVNVYICFWLWLRFLARMDMLNRNKSQHTTDKMGHKFICRSNDRVWGPHFWFGCYKSQMLQNHMTKFKCTYRLISYKEIHEVIREVFSKHFELDLGCR